MASADSAASMGAAGRDVGLASPRATARISSRRVARLVRFIIIHLCVLIDKVKRYAFLSTRLLDSSEEIDNELVGSLKIVRHELSSPPESMTVIVGLGPRDAMGIIEAEQPGFIHIMQRE